MTEKQQMSAEEAARRIKELYGAYWNDESGDPLNFIISIIHQQRQQAVEEFRKRLYKAQYDLFTEHSGFCPKDKLLNVIETLPSEAKGG